jgi:RIO kinase 1
MNVPEPLLPLYDDGFILSVTRPLMSGKEASVYLVETREGQCVAKVYKEANNRSFRQRADYTEGRQVRNSRQQRAMAKGSKYGKALIETEWQQAEVSALYRLHEAGVRVPTPFHYSDNVLLMELITDEHGQPAPRLWDIQIPKNEVQQLQKFLVRQCVRMLCAGMVHGDLSEYNILMSSKGPVIIDLPQASDAAHNRNSERLFLRDVQNLKNYLTRFDSGLRNTQYGKEIWALYESGQLHPESQLTGRHKRQSRRADTESVIAEIQAAAAEAHARPLSAYQQKKQRKTEEARAEAERAEKEAIQRAKARAERPAQGGRPPRPDRNKQAQNQQPSGDPNKKRRRRRRRRRGPKPE